MTNIVTFLEPHSTPHRKGRNISELFKIQAGDNVIQLPFPNRAVHHNRVEVEAMGGLPIVYTTPHELGKKNSYGSPLYVGLESGRKGILPEIAAYLAVLLLDESTSRVGALYISANPNGACRVLATAFQTEMRPEGREPLSPHAHLFRNTPDSTANLVLATYLLSSAHDYLHVAPLNTQPQRHEDTSSSGQIDLVYGDTGATR